MYEQERAAKEILLDAEEDLGKWEPGQNVDYAPSSPLENNLLPPDDNGTHAPDSVTGEGEGKGHTTERASENVDPQIETTT